MSAAPVICSDSGREERCAEPVEMYCYRAYSPRGSTCSRRVHFRPGRGPGHREIFCEKHGRQPWPPVYRGSCSSQELVRTPKDPSP